MNVFNITYGSIDTMPTGLTLKKTEITTYTWPGFLAELDHSTGMFATWELLGPNTWGQGLDIYAPPSDCIGVSSTKVQQGFQKGSHWTLWEHCWRLQEPVLSSLPQEQKLQAPSLLSLCGPQ